MLKTITKNPQKTSQNQITQKQQLNPQAKLLKIHAPQIAKKAQPGQFLILKTQTNSERIPLTIADTDKKTGEISIVFQEVGTSTTELGTLQIGDAIQNLAGPLGKPSEIKNYGNAAVVCGGIGAAASYPIAKALKAAGNHVTAIIGARNRGLIIFEEEMAKVSDELYVSTDDGSKGQKGFVSDVLKGLIGEGCKFNVVFAVGPPIMMYTVSEVTRPFGIKTIVSLNPIMVDGMGMCGACRVTIGNQTKFACVDGPEFDAHQVNFKELMQRLKSYCAEEKFATQLKVTGGGCGCHNH